LESVFPFSFQEIDPVNKTDHKKSGHYMIIGRPAFEKKISTQAECFSGKLCAVQAENRFL
jgi:hypothetical protein